MGQAGADGSTQANRSPCHHRRRPWGSGETLFPCFSDPSHTPSPLIPVMLHCLILQPPYVHIPSRDISIHAKWSFLLFFCLFFLYFSLIADHSDQRWLKRHLRRWRTNPWLNVYYYIVMYVCTLFTFSQQCGWFFPRNSGFHPKQPALPCDNLLLSPSWTTWSHSTPIFYIFIFSDFCSLSFCVFWYTSLLVINLVSVKWYLDINKS